jgi:hypothetical protein
MVYYDHQSLALCPYIAVLLSPHPLWRPLTKLGDREGAVGKGDGARVGVMVGAVGAREGITVGRVGDWVGVGVGARVGNSPEAMR